MNKANTIFLYLNIKVIGNEVHTSRSIYNKRDFFGFPIANCPWLSGDVSRLPSFDWLLVIWSSSGELFTHV